MSVVEEIFDDDGYPTEEFLEAVKKWDLHDPIGWFAFIKSGWWMPDWGWHETTRRYRISTGGWSGNEEILAAMEGNFVLWSMAFVRYERGGHYEFEKRRTVAKADS